MKARKLRIYGIRQCSSVVLVVRLTESAGNASLLKAGCYLCFAASGDFALPDPADYHQIQLDL